MKLMLDTNRYRDFCMGEETIVGAVQTARLVALPFVTVAELRAGFACGTKAKHNEAILVQFLAQSCVAVVCPDEETTHHYASLYKQLREQGTPIPSNDLWIATLAVQHDMCLASRDRHFHHLPQIPLI